MEEVGEISVEVLKLNGFKNSTTERKITIQNLKEECIDAMLICFDILAYLETEPEEINEIAIKKIDKWLNNIVIAKKKLKITEGAFGCECKEPYLVEDGMLYRCGNCNGIL